MAEVALRDRFWACRSREEAINFVEGLKLTVKGLREFAEQVGWNPNLLGCGRKAEQIRWLVEHTVGHKVDREAFWKS